MTQRPSARAPTVIERSTVTIAVDELVLLRAKAKACDAYRAWLADTSRRNRGQVAAALDAVGRLEGGG